MNEIPTYNIIRNGGRIKSAGASYDFVERTGNAFTSTPTAAQALETARTFSEARNNPPQNIRERFFPRDMKSIDIKGSPALYRAVLKTDQGAGKFLPFTINEETQDSNTIRHQVGIEGGYVIPETYLLSQLTNADGRLKTMADLLAVQFQNGQLPESRNTIQELRILCDQLGIEFSRKAGVGRDGFMFIHPSLPKHEIIIPDNVRANAEASINSTFAKLTDRAEEIQTSFATEHGLPTRTLDHSGMPSYFQADVHIFPNGKCETAELQVPDVGLFLSTLPTEEGSAIQKVKDVLSPMKDQIIDGLAERIREEPGKPVYLVTRSEVLDHEEDVLEIRELQAINQGLTERGHTTQAISAEAAASLDTPALLFLFNLNPNSEEFNKLKARYLLDKNGEITMTPSPFLIEAQQQVSSYDEAELDTTKLTNLRSIVKNVEAADNPDKVYMQMMALDNFLNKAGIHEDVIHFHHPSFPTPIPAYRHDVRSLHVTSKELERVGAQTATARNIPVSTERAVVFDKDGGPLYATFRFMVKM